MRAIILIPTYNEADNIVPLIREIFSLPIECSVLVIDDNSPDGTARLVRQVMSEFPNLSLLSRPGKSGLAGAYLAGFRKVLAESAADFIITMDADFSHHPKYLPDLIRAAKTADVVIGSRYVNNGGVKNWNLMGRILSFFLLFFPCNSLPGVFFSNAFPPTKDAAGGGFSTGRVGGSKDATKKPQFFDSS